MVASVTSGTTSFSLDVDELIETALDPLGGEHTSGIDAKKARRILNLLLIQLQNKDIPLNKIETIILPLVQGTISYSLDASIVDVLKATVTTPDSSPVTDLPIQRRSQEEYHFIPNKTVQNRPNLFTTERLRDAVTVLFWPAPNLNTYTAKLLVSKKVEDVTASYQKIDLPVRYQPLITKWLTYELALSKPAIDVNRLAILKSERDSVMPDTLEEDRERTDWTIVPGGISGR